MSISFKHRDVTYRFDEGDPVLVHATVERGTVEPFIGEVRERATPGRYFYVRARGERHAVPWDGFLLLEGFGRKDG